MGDPAFNKKKKGVCGENLGDPRRHLPLRLGPAALCLAQWDLGFPSSESGLIQSRGHLLIQKEFSQYETAPRPLEGPSEFCSLNHSLLSHTDAQHGRYDAQNQP